MVNIKQLARAAGQAVSTRSKTKAVNWHPGHMFKGMKAMMGKLNTVDCVIEVHDARIPMIGRNKEFRQHLGAIKPHILVLNKCDLADLSNWNEIKTKLAEKGDNNVLLTSMTGAESAHSKRGYTKLLDKAFKLINNSDRYNRVDSLQYKVMIVGIPNVGKSTLINRLRQHHLGVSGEPAKTGNEAGVTKNVEFMIKICSRPLIYSYDTPGVLEPTITKSHDTAMKLAVCSTIKDKVLKSEQLADFILKYLNKRQDFAYVTHLGLEAPPKDSTELCQQLAKMNEASVNQLNLFKGRDSINQLDSSTICWRFVKLFREGRFGLVMFEDDKLK